MQPAALVPLLAATLLLCACEREQRALRTPPMQPVSGAGERRSALLPGPKSSDTVPPPVAPTAAASTSAPVNVAQTPRPGPIPNPQESVAWQVSQGKRLFRMYNCSGCHANGGGDIGPPLMDRDWLYGGSPAQIAASIAQGRPNGMPSFAGRIPDDQLWQIVAYVRSMSGQLRSDVAPGRADTVAPGPPEQRREREPPRQGTPP